MSKTYCNRAFNHLFARREQYKLCCYSTSNPDIDKFKTITHRPFEYFLSDDDKKKQVTKLLKSVDVKGKIMTELNRPRDEKDHQDGINYIRELDELRGTDANRVFNRDIYVRSDND